MNRFWKSAIAERSIYDLSDLYQKKFLVEQRDAIATAGSCFAQHIARHLQKSGYTYLDVEPAPFNFPESLLDSFGYGHYSARYGNIYTARQLLQLVKRAFEGFAPIDQIVEDGGRYYDLLRPSIEPNGFSSRDECVVSINEHLSAVRILFQTCDVFIFTLGLTEAWVDRRDGTTFPICPGTSAGRFDTEKYTFKNFTSTEILADMSEAIAILRNIRKNLRIILTVSPVPLVATAEPRHVLVSTVYSKSVLRAVAGELEAADDLIDYFPSYEIVTGIPTRSMFFNPDMRTVNDRGVSFVMEHFFTQHPSFGPVESVGAGGRAKEARDPFCDEIALEKATL